MLQTHCGSRIDDRRKVQGTRRTAVKTFFSCALNLEPYGFLDYDYRLLATGFFDWGLGILVLRHLTTAHRSGTSATEEAW